ncbi:MAG: tRNA uridine-5-carboxymethylaminomethyl(34) synthesis enzyme MnmG [Planctomycetota bacterium]|jgi:tRNA uridine 5-carboxymethylaminomethyl modification enzyme
MNADVIVVGAGHAGVEAALAAARIGAATVLVTLDPSSPGKMACNPAIGGIAKGTVVREIDALGGEMGKAADATGLQFRMLNTGRGPSVRSPRAQADRGAYAAAMEAALRNQENLEVLAGEVRDLLVEKGAVAGVRVEPDRILRAPAVVLTTGTFLRGLIHRGEERWPAGRAGEPPAASLSASLERAGLTLGRLKTGTPPRVDGRTVDLESMTRQDGDPDPRPFSFATESLAGRKQLPCYVTGTNARLHDLVKRNLHRAPLYTGQIRAAGPRYCPSFETKIVRFPDRDRHPIYLEPEGWGTSELYCNGLSTSFPRDLQEAIVRSVPGMASARITQYGYAIEYDFVPPRGQLKPDLEARAVAGLYLAGQINGTSGYEEAAGQGLVAGINAARRCAGEAPVHLRRDQAFIGVMIDDLVTRGTTEPYRLFTSRAEYRLLLRQDNADRRLTPLGAAWNCVEPERLERLDRHEAAIAGAHRFLSSARRGAKTLQEVLRRPEVTYARLAGEEEGLGALGLDARAAEQVEIEVKYEGYIRRQMSALRKVQAMETLPIPAGFDFHGLEGLSFEARERLVEARPLTLGAAGRVEGVTPADVSVLSVHLKRLGRVGSGI